MTWQLFEANGYTKYDLRIASWLSSGKYAISPMAELLALRSIAIAARNEEIIPANYLDHLGRGLPRLNHCVRELVAAGVWVETEWGWWMDVGSSSHHVTNDDRWKLNDGLRAQVLKLHGSICKACGATERITIDHIVPVAKGGRTDLENLQPLCVSCNSSKGTKSWDDFLAKRGR